MAPQVEFPGRNWEDPDSLAGVPDEFSEGPVRCDSLNALDGPLPRSRGQLAALGITGMEFVAFRTERPRGLGTDIAPLRTEIYDLGELRHAVGEAGFALDALREAGFREGSRQDVAYLDTIFRSDETSYVEVNA